jgi:hypothetical protein
LSWLSLLSALIGLVGAVTRLMESRQLLEAGAAQAVLSNLRSSNELLEKALAARRARRVVDADPERLREDDGFRRD